MTTPGTPLTAPAALNLAPAQFVTLPPPSIVTCVPLNDEVGRPYLPYHVYIHADDGQRRQLPLDTTHLGYHAGGGMLEVVSILRWWYIPDYSAIPATGIANATAIMGQPNPGVANVWTMASTLLELDPQVTVTLPLGQDPQKLNAFPGYDLAALKAAAASGSTLSSVQRYRLQMPVGDTDLVAGQERPAARYGYARVSTREQNPDSQFDALTAAGLEPGNIVIEKISGKLASRPKLDQLLARLQPGDAVVVTRLRRIGRNHRHLLELVEWFEKHQVDFVVLEQGIDTTTPLGRLFFRFLAALAEFDREMIVEGTREGLASARVRGRTGGRPPALSQVQLDQAQRMYDEDHLTVEEIAKAFRVGRSTLYENLAAYKDGRDCVLVAYRNTRPGKVDDSNRRYGETGQSEKVQLEADRKWWPVAPARQPRLKAIVYVVNGTVARIRAVNPEGTWQRDDRGYADIPLTPPLAEIQIAEQFPTLGLRLGDHRPHVKGKIREYLTL